MSEQPRSVPEIPLTALWDESGDQLNALRIRHLTEDDISGMINGAEVQIVIAIKDSPLRWIQPDQVAEFWNDARYRIAMPDEEIILDDFPESYCFVASEWAPFEKGTLILFEKYS